MCQISSVMATAEGPVAEFSGFANFEEKKRKSNLLMSFPKIVNQMGSFGQKRKKKVFSHLSADSRYFRIYALKKPRKTFLYAMLAHLLFNQSWASAKVKNDLFAAIHESVKIVSLKITIETFIIHQRTQM